MRAIKRMGRRLCAFPHEKYRNRRTATVSRNESSLCWPPSPRVIPRLSLSLSFSRFSRMLCSFRTLDLSNASSTVPLAISRYTSPSLFLPVLPLRWMVRISDGTGS